MRPSAFQSESEVDSTRFTFLVVRGRVDEARVDDAVGRVVGVIGLRDEVALVIIRAGGDRSDIDHAVGVIVLVEDESQGVAPLVVGV